MQRKQMSGCPKFSRMEKWKDEEIMMKRWEVSSWGNEMFTNVVAMFCTVLNKLKGTKLCL